MKKIKEVIFNATVYRGISLCLQLLMVSLIFGLRANWPVVIACNILCFAWYIIYHMASIRIRHYFKHRVVGPKIRVYLSHPIRGSKVDDATKEEQMSNSERAKLCANELRKAFPELEIYCPGDAEDFVHLAYSSGMLTDTQILDIDCKILDGRDCVFAYAFDASRGMKIETDHADAYGIPVLTFEKLDNNVLRRIRTFVDGLIKAKENVEEW